MQPFLELTFCTFNLSTIPQFGVISRVCLYIQHLHKSLIYMNLFILLSSSNPFCSNIYLLTRHRAQACDLLIF